MAGVGLQSTVLVSQYRNRNHLILSFIAINFKKAGLRYELAVSLAGSIVSFSGPHAAGLFSDLRIFRERLKWQLDG